MRENQGQYPIRELAGLFGVSCSAYYKGAKQQGVSLGREEEEQYRYDSLREREPLRRDYGKRVSGKKAARLMREQGLNARRRRKRVPRGPTRTTDCRSARTC